MKIIDLLTIDDIVLNQSPQSKQDTIDILCNLHNKNGRLSNLELYKQDILARESHSNTGVGEGIAVPHAKSDAVIAEKAGIVAMTVPNGVDYGAFDGKFCNLVFMIAAPKSGADIHLEALSKLMVLLMDENLRAKLLAATTNDEFLDAIANAEEKDNKEKVDSVLANGASTKTDNSQTRKKLVAVTACPAGLAHTFMLAEKLEKTAKALDCDIVVEANGFNGAKKPLTHDEIANADGVLLCLDVAVEMSRFDGKKLYQTSVKDGMKNAEQLVKKVMSGDCGVYVHTGAKVEQNKTKASFGKQLYKHLMSGVSHMLPFVIAGGILIALSFLLSDKSHPESLGTNTTVALWFNKLGSLAFGFMLPALAGYISYSIANRAGIVVGFVGGAMAGTGMSFFNLADDPATWIPAGFLGAILAGFVAGYIMLGLRYVCDKFLPKSIDSVKSILIYPVIGCALIGAFMSLINPIMGMLNTAITKGLTALGEQSNNGNKAVAIALGALLAGMMAVDMGGPINKTAYLFGTFSLTATGLSTIGTNVMAAVMVGGMAPPLIVAVSATIFRNKYTKDEKKLIPISYILGACFITEGAIPYASTDAKRVIPSLVVGSAVGGALSMAFNVFSVAPQGGIFVFGLLGDGSATGVGVKIALYALSIVIGVIVGAVMLGLIKKKVPKDPNEQPKVSKKDKKQKEEKKEENTKIEVANA